MKKISIFLCTIICILLLGGCGTQQNETISNSENNTTPPISNSTVDTSGENDTMSSTTNSGDITANNQVASEGIASNEVITNEDTVNNETVTPSNSTSNETITVDDAKANALAHAGLTSEQATFTESKLDYDDGRQVYELEFYSGNNEYDYEIDAYTGEVVSYDCEADGYVECYDLPLPSSSDTAITADEAKELALAQVPGAAASDIKEFKTEYDDGRTEYEGKIIYDRIEYEFEIDSVGNILSWEEEPLHSTMQPK